MSVRMQVVCIHWCVGHICTSGCTNASGMCVCVCMCMCANDLRCMLAAPDNSHPPVAQYGASECVYIHSEGVTTVHEYVCVCVFMGLWCAHIRKVYVDQ